MEEQVLPIGRDPGTEGMLPDVFAQREMLRAYFRYDRSLLNGLSRAAWRAVHRYLEGLRGSVAIPGGGFIRFDPT
ncbi:hypothetical protein ACFL41_01405 [Gemmatimonadota bacterium]